MSESIAAGDRPSFAEAFAADATPVADSPSASTTPSPDATTADSPVAAIAPSVTPPLDAASTPTKGPLPYEAHKRILDGAYAERDTLKQQVDNLRWAEGLDRAALTEGERLGKLYQQDRPAFIRQLLAEASTDPELIPLVRSEAARVLGTRTPPPAATPASLEPDIPVLDERGQVVAQAFSADRVRQLIAQSVQDAITKEVGPMRQDFQSRQARDQADATQRQLTQSVNDAYAELVDVLPGFEAHQAEIAKVMATIPGDPVAAARKAWKQVVGATLSNANETRAQTLDSLKTRAAASTVNPASAAIASTHRPTSFFDPTLSWG